MQTHHVSYTSLYLSQDQISTTVASVVGEYLKTTERTNFWSEELNANVDPFLSLEGGFFTASWDFKVRPKLDSKIDLTVF